MKSICQGILPDEVLIHAEFFGAAYKDDGMLQGKALSVFRDSEGNQWCAFEMADMAGVFVIALGSNFFIGWSVP